MYQEAQCLEKKHQGIVHYQYHCYSIIRGRSPIYSGQIDYETATCFFVTNAAYSTQIENANQITPLGCIAKNQLSS